MVTGDNSKCSYFSDSCFVRNTAQGAVYNATKQTHVVSLVKGISVFTEEFKMYSLLLTTQQLTAAASCSITCLNILNAVLINNEENNQCLVW